MDLCINVVEALADIEMVEDIEKKVEDGKN